MSDMNRFDQLVQDLIHNRITLNQVQMAIRASIRENPGVPDEVKDILCGRGEAYAGLVYKMFKSIGEAIASVELAFRRGGERKE